MALANEWCDIFFLVVVALTLAQSAGEFVSAEQVGNMCCWKYVIVAKVRKPSNLNDTDTDTNETASTPPTPPYTTPGTTGTLAMETPRAPMIETPGTPMIESPATPDKLQANEGTNDAPLSYGGNYEFGSPPANGGNYGGGYGGNYGGNSYGGNYGGGNGGNYGGGYDYYDPNPGYNYNYGYGNYGPGVPNVIYKDGKWVLRDDIY